MRVHLLLCLSIVLCGCEGGGSDPPTPPRIASVMVSPDGLALDALGASARLDASARDTNGNQVSAVFAWSSSDTTVVTVDANGLVTARGNGQATITASTGGMSSSVIVTVVTVASVTVSPDGLVFEALTDDAPLTAVARDSDGGIVSVEFGWVSSDPSIATVDDFGRVTARGNGTATITVSAGGLSASAMVEVAQRTYRLEIGPTNNLTIFESIGQRIQFTGEAWDSNGHQIAHPVITAEAFDDDIAVIDENLVATAKHNGSTFIQFFLDGERNRYRTVDVEVHQIAARMELNPSGKTFRQLRETHRFEADAWDANGHPLPDEFLYWESVDPRVAVVDDTGLVTITGNGETGIVLRADRSSFSASAAVSGELQATCAGAPMTPSIMRVEPESLVEGASVIIEGTGFCPEAPGNLVTIDGLASEVSAASETMLRVTVPHYCQPARDVEVTVAVGANSASRLTELRPDEADLSLPVGQQLIIGAGTDRCLQFTETNASESYLIGVQSTLLGLTDALTRVRLIAATNAPVTETPVAMGTQWQGWSGFPDRAPVPVTTNGSESEQWERQSGDVLLYGPDEVQSRASFSALSAVTFPSVGDVDELPEVGDIVTLVFPGPGSEYLVYAIGSHAIWLVAPELVELVEAQYVDRLEYLSDSFDNQIYPVITNYFGIPELGNTGRIVITIREEYGGAFVEVGPAGRKWKRVQIPLRDFFPRYTLAHELVHVIQPAVLDGDWNYEPWFDEGQAELGGEVFGFALFGLSPGQNYGMVNNFEPSDIRWIADDHWTYLSSFFGGTHSRKPQECSWLVFDNAPCNTPPLPYHVGWSLLRWMTDQYARLYPGGGAYFHQQLLRSGIGPPIKTIEDLLGETMETLLARWAAALYVDGRISADPWLEFTSYDVWRNHGHDGLYGNIATRPRRVQDPNPRRGLYPAQLKFDRAQHQARIRDGSIWYLNVSGETRPATAIRVLDREYGPPPDDIQIWAVRLE